MSGTDVRFFGNDTGIYMDMVEAGSAKQKYHKLSKNTVILLGNGIGNRPWNNVGKVANWKLQLNKLIGDK